MSARDLLSMGFRNIPDKYSRARQVKRRLDKIEFYRDLKMVYDYRQLYNEFIRLTYLKDVEMAKIGKVWNASSTLLRIFKSDTTTMLAVRPDNFTHRIEAYEKYFGKEILRIKQHMEDLELKLNELQQIIEICRLQSCEGTSIEKDAMSTFVAKQVYVKLVLAKHNIKTLNDTIRNRLRRAHNGGDSLLNSLPYTIYPHDEYCNGNVTKLSATLTALTYNVGRLVKNSSQNISIHSLHGDITDYFKYSEQVVKCITAYETILREVQDWNDRVADNVERLLSIHQKEKVTTNFGDKIERIEGADRELQLLLLKYALDVISVQEFLENLNNHHGTSRMPAEIENLLNAIETELFRPLHERLQDIKKDTIKNYDELFGQIAKLKPFFSRSYFYTASQHVNIQRNPEPDLDHPDKYDSKSRDFRKATEDETTIEHFLNFQLPSQMRKGVSNYCAKLQSTIDETEAELTDIGRKVEDFANEARKRHDEFMRTIQIDHQFIK